MRERAYLRNRDVPLEKGPQTMLDLCSGEQSQSPREKETKVIMTINILLWIAAGMAVWAALIIAIILFFMGAHVDDEDEK